MSRSGILRAMVLPMSIVGLIAAGDSARSQPRNPQSDRPAAYFSPPSQPLRLTRELHRELGDGKEIVTRRTYGIRITRAGNGYVVDGELIDSAISAPPFLAQLAAIERSRPDTGMFPFRLDQQGRIRATPPPGSPALHAHFDAASRSVIASAPVSAAQRADMRRFAEAVMAGNTTPIPEDLLHPAPGSRGESNHYQLPDGASGTVSVAITAEADPATGLLRTLTRAITTDNGGNRRSSREIWTLTPQAE